MVKNWGEPYKCGVNTQCRGKKKKLVPCIKRKELWGDISRLAAVSLAAVETSALECCSCFVLFTSLSLAEFPKESNFLDPAFTAGPSPVSAPVSSQHHTHIPHRKITLDCKDKKENMFIRHFSISAKSICSFEVF